MKIILTEIVDLKIDIGTKFRATHHTLGTIREFILARITYVSFGNSGKLALIVTNGEDVGIMWNTEASANNIYDVSNEELKRIPNRRSVYSAN
jgi:hypothetical protein